MRRPIPTSLSSWSAGDARPGSSPQVRPTSKNAAAAHVEQAERIPVGEVALLDGEYRTLVACLKAQRVAAQTGVAAKHEVLVEIEILTVGAVQADVQKASI